MLSSHEAIEAASADQPSLKDRLLPLLSEMRFEVPLVTAGLIALASGPAAATFAGLVAAGVGAVAVKELIDQTTSAPDPERFAEALKNGAVVLWVAVGDQEQATKARDILSRHGAVDIHTHSGNAV